MPEVQGHIPSGQCPKTEDQRPKPSPLVPRVPVVPFVPRVPDVRDVSSNARCPKKNRTRPIAEARASARAYLQIRNSEFGIWNFRESRLKTPRRFNRFSRFRRFICFTRFNRFRCRYDPQKMKHPGPNIGTRVRDLIRAYFLKSKTMLANAFTPTSSRLSSMMKSGVW